jgi:hypothetical protein
MHCRGGRVYFLEEDNGDDQLLRVTVFVQAAEELENLGTFGNAIAIAGTHGPLNTEWEVVPVTLLDRGRHIQVGGIMFAAYFTTDAIP